MGLTPQDIEQVKQGWHHYQLRQMYDATWQLHHSATANNLMELAERYYRDAMYLANLLAEIEQKGI